MFFYHQCPTVCPETGGGTDGSQCDVFLKTSILGPVLEEPPHEAQTENVSSSVVY